jgi:hypothetical protein
VADKERRVIQPVIVTDRVIYADRTVREWTLSEPLICLSYPVGFDGCERPIVLIVNNPGHIAALQSFAVALAHKAMVQPGDLGLGLREGAGIKAREAFVKHGEAYKKIMEEWDRGALTDELAEHLFRQLETNADHCRAFSTSWIYGSVLYGPLALKKLQPYKEKIKTAFFGDYDLSKGMDATDEARSRKFYKEICSHMDRLPTDRPEDSRIVVPLTEMLLKAVLPELIPDFDRTIKIDCADIDSVSRARKRDIKGNRNFSDEQTQRSFGAVPITSLCT